MSISPSIQIAFRCDVCEQEKIENAFTVHRRARELGTHVCRECNERAEGFAVSVVVDSVVHKPPPDPYTRTVIDFGMIDEYRPPTHRSRNWLGLFIAVVLVISAAVVIGRVWG